MRHMPYVYLYRLNEIKDMNRRETADIYTHSSKGGRESTKIIKNSRRIMILGGQIMQVSTYSGHSRVIIAKTQPSSEVYIYLESGGMFRAGAWSTSIVNKELSSAEVGIETRV